MNNNTRKAVFNLINGIKELRTKEWDSADEKFFGPFSTVHEEIIDGFGNYSNTCISWPDLDLLVTDLERAMTEEQ